MAKEFVSAYELSRLLNLPYARITALLHSGKLKPDAVSSGGKVALFAAARVRHIEDSLDVLLGKELAAVSRRARPSGRSAAFIVMSGRGSISPVG